MNQAEVSQKPLQSACREAPSHTFVSSPADLPLLPAAGLGVWGLHQPWDGQSCSPSSWFINSPNCLPMHFHGEGARSTPAPNHISAQPSSQSPPPPPASLILPLWALFPNQHHLRVVGEQSRLLSAPSSIRELLSEHRPSPQQEQGYNRPGLRGCQPCQPSNPNPALLPKVKPARGALYSHLLRLLNPLWASTWLCKSIVFSCLTLNQTFQTNSQAGSLL